MEKNSSQAKNARELGGEEALKDSYSDNHGTALDFQARSSQETLNELLGTAS